MTTNLKQDRYTRKRERNERLDFRIIFALSFVIFLLASVGERLLPRHWLAGSQEKPRKTIIAEALETTRITVPYAFMG